MHKRKLYKTAGIRQLPGGVEYNVPGTNLTRFKGNLHDNGGILLNQDAEVEGGETKGTVTMAGGNPTEYIFSTFLNMDGTKGYNDGKETIADASVKIAKQGGDLNQLAKFQERLAGRDGTRISRNGGPINYQTEGVVEDDQPQFNYPGEQFIDEDSSYWSYYTADESKHDWEGMDVQTGMRYMQDSKLTDYSWILPSEILAAGGTGSGSNYRFTGASEKWTEFYNNLDSNDTEQFFQKMAMTHLEDHGAHNAWEDFVGYPYIADNTNPMPHMKYKTSLAVDLKNDYEEMLAAQGDQVALFNNDFNGGPILATKEALTEDEIEVIRQERLTAISVAWDDMEDYEKLVVYDNLKEFAPDAITDRQQGWYNELSGDLWQMTKPLYQDFQNSRNAYVSGMSHAEDPTQQDILGTQPGQIGSTEGIGAGTQLTANIIDILGLDTKYFDSGSIQDFTYDQWMALGMPQSYEELGIIPLTTLMDPDKIFTENGQTNDAYILDIINQHRPEDVADMTEQQYMQAGVGKNLFRYITSIPGAVKYARTHGWKNLWGGMTKGKAYFKNARTKQWTQHPASKQFQNKNFKKPKVKTKTYPDTVGGFIDKQLSRDGFLAAHWKKILGGGATIWGIWQAGKDIADIGPGEVEDSEGYTPGGGDPNFHPNYINIIDINSDGFDNAVLDSLQGVIEDSGVQENPGYVPPLNFEQKRYGGEVYDTGGDMKPISITGDYQLWDGTVFFKGADGSLMAFTTPEEYEAHRAERGLETDYEFKDMVTFEDDNLSDQELLSFMDAADLVSKGHKYKAAPYYQEIAGRVTSGESPDNTNPNPNNNTNPNPNNNTTTDRSQIPTTNVASDVYYQGDVYGDIAKQQGKQTFEFADGNTIDLYGDEHLFGQISAGGVDAWGTDWFKNANPEILSAAGITSFADFKDPANILAYQKAWNQANPNNLIREDSFFGEQTTRTAFAPTEVNENNPPDETPPGVQWKSPNDWRWLIPAVGAAAQLIGPLKARNLKPRFTSAMMQPKTSLERVDMNQQRSANTADLNALKTYVGNNVGGPASMANIQAAFAAKRRADAEVWQKENEMNAGIANAESKINAEIVANNAKNALAANTFNAEALTRNDETKLAAWDAMGNRIGGMAKDWLGYLAERDKARAIAGPEMYDRNLFFAANPHLDPTSEEAATALNEWRKGKKQNTYKMLYNKNWT